MRGIVWLLLILLTLPYSHAEISVEKWGDTEGDVMDIQGGAVDSAKFKYIDITDSNFTYDSETMALTMTITFAEPPKTDITPGEENSVTYSFFLSAEWNCFIDSCESSYLFVRYSVEENKEELTVGDVRTDGNSLIFSVRLNESQTIAADKMRPAEYAYGTGSEVYLVSGTRLKDDSVVKYTVQDTEQITLPFLPALYLLPALALISRSHRKE